MGIKAFDLVSYLLDSRGGFSDLRDEVTYPLRLPRFGASAPLSHLRSQ